jgi:hypothetical protein
MQLAYLFWHWPATGADPGQYARDLVAFQAALGLPGAHSLRLRRAPFDGPPDGVFEDWYPVDGWAALGELNERAVSGDRRAPHDTAAARAAGGAGGVYRLVAGDAALAAPAFAAWLAKPAGETYEAFLPALEAAAPGAAIWQRQMVLGPAPELAVLAPAPVSLPWPSIATGPEPVRPS